MTLSGRRILLAAALFLSTFPQPTPSRLPACAIAPPQNGQVAISDETAVIVWDAATKTEHFIRRASFQTAVKDFGFIVPTPTQPTLVEVNDQVFAELARVTAPRVVTQPRQTSTGGCGCSANKALFLGSAAPEAAVRVLDQTSVAGYDAAVLEADNADVLGKWLLDHGYEFSPTLKDWAEIYIKMKWKLTAFKIAKPAAGAPAVSTSAVRMTFATERPFYPYREPKRVAATANTATSSRLLRVFFLGDKIVQATIGEGENKWPAHVPFAKTIAPTDREQVFQLLKLPKETSPPTWWLTEFEDRSFPRPGADDVFYRTTEQQLQRERPPQIQYVSNNLPGAMMFCAVGIYLATPGLLRRLRKRRVISIPHAESPV